MNLEHLVDASYITPLHGKILQITCTDFPKRKIYVLFNHVDIQFTSQAQQLVDITISGPLNGFVALAIKKQAADLRACNINIHGDLNTATDMQNLFYNLDIDWEEYLSKFTGDVIAHQAVYLFKQARLYQEQANAHLEHMLKEYLQEESGLLPTNYEVDEFIQAVDQLRMDTDRLEAKVKLLESN